MTSDMIYGQGRVELIEKATEAIAKEFVSKGIIVERLYWIGTMRLPDKVKQALDAKSKLSKRRRVGKTNLEKL